MSDPRLSQVNIVVNDIPGAVDFFRLLGVQVDETLPEWMAHHRETRSHDTLSVDLDSAAFTPAWNEGYARHPAAVVLTFNVGSRSAVDETISKLAAAGVEIRQRPFDAFWGARFAVVAGPGDFDIGLTSDRDNALRSAPPDPAAFGA